jgi:hypothetical protein
MQNWLKISLVFAVFVSFVVAILLLLFGASPRLMGIPFVILGFASIIGAQEAASVLARPDVVRRISLGTRTESTVRPTTLILWGFGVVIAGLIQLLSF